VQSLRIKTDELADFHLINCNVALNLLDQTGPSSGRGTNSLLNDILPQGLIVISRDILLTVRIRVKVRLGSRLELRLGLGSELQSGLELRLGSMGQSRSHNSEVKCRRVKFFWVRVSVRVAVTSQDSEVKCRGVKSFGVKSRMPSARDFSFAVVR
jgi:hypothetical protein